MPFYFDPAHNPIREGNIRVSKDPSVSFDETLAPPQGEIMNFMIMNGFEGVPILRRDRSDIAIFGNDAVRTAEISVVSRRLDIAGTSSSMETQTIGVVTADDVGEWNVLLDLSDLELGSLYDIVVIQSVLGLDSEVGLLGEFQLVETAPSPAITFGPAQFREEEGVGVIAVSVDTVPAADLLTVSVITTDISARGEGIDYRLLLDNNTLTFSEDMLSQPLMIELNDDDLYENEETFILSIFLDEYVFAGAVDVTIRNDDEITIGFNREVYSVTESSEVVTLAVSVLNGEIAETESLVVRFATSSGEPQGVGLNSIADADEAVDYGMVSRDLLFTSDMETHVISVSITDDADIEYAEKFLGLLTIDADIVQVNTSTAAVVIEANDNLPRRLEPFCDIDDTVALDDIWSLTLHGSQSCYTDSEGNIGNTLTYELSFNPSDGVVASSISISAFTGEVVALVVPKRVGAILVDITVTSYNGESIVDTIGVEVLPSTPGSYAICSNILAVQASLEADECRALIDLYESTDGDNWYNNAGWHRSLDINEWAGVSSFIGLDGLVQFLDVELSANNLMGEIPSSIGSIRRLRTLDLSGNNLTGAIPPSIGSFLRLRTLDLSDNNLTGAIPSSTGSISALALDLSGNNLTGEALPFMGDDLTRFTILDLSDNNLTGGISSHSFMLLESIVTLDLSGNNLTGEIPSAPGIAPSLEDLVMLDLSDNNFTGEIPSWIPEANHLEMLDLSGNSLTGAIPPYMFDRPYFLQTLNLADNNLNSEIPSSIAELENLRTLDLSGNSFTGEIPSSIGDLTNLRVLNLSNNDFTGLIPFSIGDLLQLTDIVLDGNSLTGSLPFYFDPAHNPIREGNIRISKDPSVSFDEALAPPQGEIMNFMIMDGFEGVPILRRDRSDIAIFGNDAVPTAEISVVSRRLDIASTSSFATGQASSVETQTIGVVTADDVGDWNVLLDLSDLALGSLYDISISQSVLGLNSEVGSLGEFQLVETAPSPAITFGPAQFREEEGVGVIAVSVDIVPTADLLTVSVITTDISARGEGIDYRLLLENNTLTFSEGMLSQPLMIELNDDDLYENDESFRISLFLGQDTFLDSVDVVIRNSDEITIGFSPFVYKVPEDSGFVTLTVSIQEGMLEDPVTFSADFSTTGGEVPDTIPTGLLPSVAAVMGVDYHSADRQLQFDHQLQTHEITIAIENDSDIEQAERFFGVLLSSNDFIKVSTAAVVIIEASDNMPVRIDPFCAFSPTVLVGTIWTLSLSDCFADSTGNADNLTYEVSIDPLSDAGGSIEVSVTASGAVLTFIPDSSGVVVLDITVTSYNGESISEVVTLESFLDLPVFCQGLLGGSVRVDMAECEALFILYEGTNGDDWIRKDNWGFSPNLDNWYGVTSEIGEDGLAHVSHLELSSNNVTGDVFSFINAFTELKTLNLSSNNLTGTIPSTISELKNLQELELSSNDLIGELGYVTDVVLATLTTSLITLGLSDNNLSGTIPSAIGNFRQLETLDLSGNNLIGSIPFEIGILWNLTTLDLSDNNLIGDIPTSLGNLLMLGVLALDGNSLTGILPFYFNPANNGSRTRGISVDKDSSVRFAQTFVSPKAEVTPDISEAPNGFEGVPILQENSIGISSTLGTVRTAMVHITLELRSNIDGGFDDSDVLHIAVADDFGSWRTDDLDLSELTGRTVHRISIHQEVLGLRSEREILYEEFQVVQTVSSPIVTVSDTVFNESAGTVTLHAMVDAVPSSQEELILVVLASDRDATLIDDYRLLPDNNIDNVVFREDTLSATVVIDLIADDLYESEEGFDLVFLMSDLFTLVAVANFTIVDDTEVTVGFSPDAYFVAEDEESVTLNFELLDGIIEDPQTISVLLETQDILLSSSGNNTAAAGEDYTAITGAVITFNEENMNAAVTISIMNDQEIELDERFIVVLTSATTGNLRVNFADSATVVIGASDNTPRRSAPPCELIVSQVGVETFLDLSECYEDARGNSESLVFGAIVDETSLANGSVTISGSVLIFTLERSAQVDILVISGNGESITDTITLRPTFGTTLCGSLLDDEINRNNVLVGDCAALLTLYESLNGETWIDREGWAESLYLDDWYGVETVVETDGIARVSQVNLPSNNLSGTIPPSLSGLRGLEVLNVSDNSLNGDTSSFIEHFRNLRILNLSGNAGLGDDFGDVLDALANLTASITTLELSGMNLTGDIPPSIGDLWNLQVLDLSDNLLEGELPSSFGNLVDLTRLRLARNSLRGALPFYFNPARNASRSRSIEVTKDSSVSFESVFAPPDGVVLEELKAPEGINVLPLLPNETITIVGTGGAVRTAQVKVIVRRGHTHITDFFDTVAFTGTAIVDDFGRWSVSLDLSSMDVGELYRVIIQQSLLGLNSGSNTIVDMFQTVNTASSPSVSFSDTFLREDAGVAVVDVTVDNSDGVSYILVFSRDITAESEGESMPDYSLTASGGDFLVGFNSNRLTRPLRITLYDDHLYEGDETFIAGFFINGTDTLLASAEFTILDTDNVEVGFSSPTYTFGEDGNVIGGLPEVILLEGEISEGSMVTVAVSTIDGSATSSDSRDYTPLAGVEVVLTSDAPSAFVDIQLEDDQALEGSEEFSLLLSSTNINVQVSSAIATVVILPDDDNVVIGFTPSVYTMSEEEGRVSTNLAIVDGEIEESAGLVSVSVQTTDGSATADEDYVSIPDTEIVFSSDISVNSLDVDIIPDERIEPFEEFRLEAYSDDARIEVMPAVAVVNIEDADTASVSVQASTSVASEGEEITFIVSIDAQVTEDLNAVVHLNCIDAKSEDFDGVLCDSDFVIRISAAVYPSTAILVVIKDDAIPESLESFNFEVVSVESVRASSSDSSIAAIVADRFDVSSASLMLSISSNDMFLPPSASILGGGNFGVEFDAEVREGEIIEFTIELEGERDGDAGVSWYVDCTEHRLVASEDLGNVTCGTFALQTVTFGQGQTQVVQTVSVVSDSIIESSEKFVVSLVDLSFMLYEEVDSRIVTRTVLVPQQDADDIFTVKIVDENQGYADIQLMSDSVSEEASEREVSFAVILDTSVSLDVTAAVRLDCLSTEDADFIGASCGDIIPVVIPAGSTSALGSLGITDDSEDEDSEDFELRLIAVSREVFPEITADKFRIRSEAVASVIIAADDTPPLAPPEFCETNEDVLPIPLNECAALSDLYFATNGAGWNDASGWLMTTAISSWHGIFISNGHVSSLNLSGNNLVGALPASIGDLFSLRVLHLDGNTQLTGAVPSTIGHLLNLQIMNIGNTGLSGEVPYHISSLISLFDPNGLSIVSTDVAVASEETFIPSWILVEGEQQAGDNVYTLAQVSTKATFSGTAVPSALITVNVNGVDYMTQSDGVDADLPGAWSLEVDDLVLGMDYSISIIQSVYPPLFSSSPSFIPVFTVSSLPSTGVVMTNFIYEISLVANDLRVTEGSASMFTFSLNEPITEDVVIVWELACDEGSGTVDTQDFSNAFCGSTGNVSILSGSEETVFAISTEDDNVLELDEIFTLSLIGISSTIEDVRISHVSMASVTIEDNDVAVISVSPTVSTVSEGDEVVFTVTLNNDAKPGIIADANITVSWGLADACSIVGITSADFADDPPCEGGEVVIASGVRAVTFAVRVADDAIVEGSEEFAFELRTLNPTMEDRVGISAVFSRASVTIEDNDDAVISVSAAVSTVSGGDDAVFTVSLLDGITADEDITVVWEVTCNGDPAMPDFAAEVCLSGIVTIPAGLMSDTFTVSTGDGSALEGVEMFTVSLSNPMASSLGFVAILSDAFTVMTIVNNVSFCNVVLDENGLALGVPLVECEALVDLYESTNGPDWDQRTGWAQIDTTAIPTLPIEDWEGILVQFRDSMPHIIQLRLTQNGLNGEIPESIGNLLYLDFLVLSRNMLTGEIPSTIGNIVNLGSLDLSQNGLDGEIPSTIGNIANLRSLSLSQNGLDGEIPSAIGDLVNLEHLQLGFNEFSGEIPSAIGNLPNLINLNIGSNMLTGAIPNSIGDLVNLKSLTLGDNGLTGSIPNSIGDLVNLEILRLSENGLGGEIPSTLGNLLNIEQLRIDRNSFSGVLPSFIGDFLNLTRFTFHENNDLSGTIPYHICESPLLSSRINPAGTQVSCADALTFVPNWNFEGAKLSNGGYIVFDPVAITGTDAVHTAQITVRLINGNGETVFTETALAAPLGSAAPGSWELEVDGVVSGDYTVVVHQALYLDRFDVYQLTSDTRTINNRLQFGARVGFSPSSYSVSEDARSVTLTAAILFGEIAINDVVTVSVRTLDGDAVHVAGGDYIGLTSAVLTFTADAMTQTVDVVILNDNLLEDDEEFQVILSDPVGSMAEVIVSDDASSAVVTIEGSRAMLSLSSNMLRNLRSVSTGRRHTCVIREDSSIACWGLGSNPNTPEDVADVDYDQASPPVGRFQNISAGAFHTCGVREDETAACWGYSEVSNSTPPFDRFLNIGSGDFHACGIREDGTAACWGNNQARQSDPPSGRFLSLSAGSTHTCGIRAGGSVEGTVTCWGSNNFNESNPLSGRFLSISAGAFHTCGIRENGTVECWGLNSFGQINPLSGNFKSISAGDVHTCGIREDDTATCWGNNLHGQSEPPPNVQFQSLSADESHTCGIRKDGLVECWGDNTYSQSTPASAITEGDSIIFTVALPDNATTDEALGIEWQVECINSGAGVTSGDFAVSICPSGTVTIPVASASSMFTLTTNRDSTVEGLERFIVKLLSISPNSEGLITFVDTASTALVTIADNNEAIISLSPATDTVTEGDSVIFTVKLLDDITADNDIGIEWIVNCSGDITTSDFAGEACLSESVTIPAGSVSVTFAISTRDDSLRESQEIFTVNLLRIDPNIEGGIRISNTLSSGVVTIVDNDNFCTEYDTGPGIGVPFAECVALFDLWNATAGPKNNEGRRTGWLDSSGWMQLDITETSDQITEIGDWFGVTVEEGHITGLFLDTNELTGPIPSSIGNLTNLERLVLFDNLLTGPIPSSIGNLTNLNRLSLSGNILAGPIPSSIGNLTNLNRLLISGNALTGPIPSSIGNIVNLQFLILNDNELNGDIPTSIGNLTELRILRLATNERLSGTVPYHLCESPLLVEPIQLLGTQASCAAASTFVPNWEVEDLDLTDGSYTVLQLPIVITGTGAVHDALITLQLLDSDNEIVFTETVTAAPFGSAAPGSWSVNVEVLRAGDSTVEVYQALYPNNSGIYQLTSSARTMNNQLRLPFCELAEHTAGLAFGIPSVPIAECEALVDLYKSTNGQDWMQSHGWMQIDAVGLLSEFITIPNWLGVNVENGHVTKINLNGNGLSGAIPPSIDDIVNLIELQLEDNNLTGVIPSALGNLMDLQILGLSENELSGEIPEFLDGMVNLRRLKIGDNNLTGTIPSFIGNLVNLELLRFGNNELQGEIPSSLGNLVNLELLALDSNELQGEIPSSLNSLVNLVILSLDNNELQGEIPSYIGNFVNLGSLSLNNNELRGEAPSSIGNLINLGSFALANNHELSGVIPYHICEKPGLSKDAILMNTELSCADASTFVPNWEVEDADLTDGVYTVFDIPAVITGLDAVHTAQIMVRVIDSDNKTIFAETTTAASFGDVSPGSWSVNLENLRRGDYTVEVYQALYPDDFSVYQLTSTARTVDNKLGFGLGIGFSPFSYSVSEDAGSVELSVSVLSGEIEEGASVTLSVMTIDGTAVAGEDYDQLGGTLLTFTADMMTHTVSVLIEDDMLLENSENFMLELSSTSDVFISASRAVVTIEDSSRGVISVMAATDTVSEGAEVGFIVNLSGNVRPDEVIGVSWSVVCGAGSGVTSEDFADSSCPSGMVTISSGETSATFAVSTSDDDVVEGLEEFDLTLTDVVPNIDGRITISDTMSTASVTITDNDAPVSRYSRRDRFRGVVVQGIRRSG